MKKTRENSQFKLIPLFTRPAANSQGHVVNVDLSTVLPPGRARLGFIMGGCFYVNNTGGFPAVACDFEIQFTNVTFIKLPASAIVPATGTAQIDVGPDLVSTNPVDFPGDLFLPGDLNLAITLTGYKRDVAVYPALYQFTFTLTLGFEIFGQDATLGGALG